MDTPTEPITRLGGSFKFTLSTWDVLRGDGADVTVPHV